MALDPADWNNTFATHGTVVAFTSFAFLELLDAGGRKGDCPGRKSQVLFTMSVGLAVVVVSVGWPAKPSILLFVPVKLAVIALTAMRASLAACNRPCLG